MPEIRRVHEENFRVYGARKVWRQLGREEHRRGSVHGRAADALAGSAGSGARPQAADDDRAMTVPNGHWIASTGSSRPRRPNELWVADFT